MASNGGNVRGKTRIGGNTWLNGIEFRCSAFNPTITGGRQRLPSKILNFATTDFFGFGLS
jgi:hypothetical protein